MKQCSKDPSHIWDADIPFCPYCNMSQEARIYYLQQQSKKEQENFDQQVLKIYKRVKIKNQDLKPLCEKIAKKIDNCTWVKVKNSLLRSEGVRWFYEF